jgi:hypothetical protein
VGSSPIAFSVSTILDCATPCYANRGGRPCARLGILVPAKCRSVGPAVLFCSWVCQSASSKAYSEKIISIHVSPLRWIGATKPLIKGQRK